MQDGEGHVGFRARRWWHCALAVASGLFLWQVWRYRGALIDDAYISLRYGRHWAEGLGLVFNVGERVEGYTNFLWVILGGLLHRTPVSPVLGLRLISLGATLVLVASSLRLLRRIEVQPGAAPRAPWLDVPVAALLIVLASDAALAYYATTVMESMLFASLLMAAVVCLLQERGWLGETSPGGHRRSVWLFVLLALTRPEGVLLFVMAHSLLWLLAGAWHPSAGAWHQNEKGAEPGVEDNPAGAWHLSEGRDGAVREDNSAGAWHLLRPSLTDGFVFAGVYGLYFVWRWSFYGELFPNTYYAKVTGGPEQWHNGFLALAGWATSHPLWVLVLLLVPAVLWHRRRTRDARTVAFLWSLSVLWLTYVVSIGGDFMPFFRFFLPLLAPLAVLTVWLWRWTPWPRTVKSRSLWLGLGVVVQLLAGSFNEEALRAYVAHRTTVVGLEVGRFLANQQRPDELVATNTVGSLPYQSGLPTLDMLGLTDKAIARHPIYVVSPRWAGHRRGWGDYVLRRRPRVVLWYNSAGAADPHYLGDHQLADDPFFRFFYQARVETLPLEGSDGTEARFPGKPFGGEDGTPLWLPELGSQIEVSRVLGWPWTSARPAAIRLHYFERRLDRDAMWEWTDEGDLNLFLRRLVEHWRRQAPQAGDGDPAARQQVEGLCRRALVAIEQQDRETAKELLRRAVAENGRARSPMPFQYITNLAFLEGQLFLAIHSQQEALRLEPGNALYAANLKSLLEQPFADYRAAVTSAATLSSAATRSSAVSAGGASGEVAGTPKQPTSKQSR